MIIIQIFVKEQNQLKTKIIYFILFPSKQNKTKTITQNHNPT